MAIENQKDSCIDDFKLDQYGCASFDIDGSSLEIGGEKTELVKAVTGDSYSHYYSAKWNPSRSTLVLKVNWVTHCISSIVPSLRENLW